MRTGDAEVMTESEIKALANGKIDIGEEVCRAGHFEMIEKFRTQVDFDFRTLKGETCLHLAVKHGRDEFVSRVESNENLRPIFENQANLTTPKDSDTPLHYLTKYCKDAYSRAKLATTILRLGGNPNAINSEKFKPHHYLINSRADEAIFLLETASRKLLG